MFLQLAGGRVTPEGDKTIAPEANIRRSYVRMKNPMVVDMKGKSSKAIQP